MPLAARDLFGQQQNRHFATLLRAASQSGGALLGRQSDQVRARRVLPAEAAELAEFEQQLDQLVAHKSRSSQEHDKLVLARQQSHHAAGRAGQVEHQRALVAQQPVGEAVRARLRLRRALAARVVRSRRRQTQTSTALQH